MTQGDACYSGVIKAFFEDKGFGFIQCPELEQHGDVFVHHKQFSGLAVGDRVSFKVRFKNGKPQAEEVKEFSQSSFTAARLSTGSEKPGTGDRGMAMRTAPADMGVPDRINSGGETEDEGMHRGVIKAIFEDKGFGFIQCPVLEGKYGDVFVHHGQLKGFFVGDRVAFNVRFKNGKPQADEVKQPSPSASNWLSPSTGQPAAKVERERLVPVDYMQASRELEFEHRPQEADSGSGETFHEGVVKSFNSAKGFGFVRCQETFSMFNCDVFLHKDQLGSFQAGDAIRFSCQVNDRGQPQATEVRGPGPSASTPGGVEPLTGADLAYEAWRESGRGTDPDSTSQSLLAALLGGVKPATSWLAEEPPAQVAAMSSDERRRPRAGSGSLDEPSSVLRNLLGPSASFLDSSKPGSTVAIPASPQLRAREDSIDVDDFLECEQDGEPGGDEEDEDEAEEPEVELEEGQYRGVVISINASKGFGFIRCPRTFEIHSQDIFVDKKFLAELQVGEGVVFKVHMNARGQPQAIEVRSCSKPTASSSSRAPKEVDRSNRSRGVVKQFSADKGFGFIRSAEVAQRYGTDVFVHQKQIEQFVVGDRVTFVVKVGKSGKPQASKLEADEALDEEDSVPMGKEAPTHEGTIKKVDKEKKFGFIYCEALFDSHGCDIFVHSKHLEGPGLVIGDRVRFSFKESRNGRLMATFVEPMPSEDEEAEELTGKIKSFDDEHGYGFISSAEATAAHGRDVFLHSRQIGDFKVGDFVSFRVRISSNGQPQAYKLSEGPSGLAWLQSEAAPAEEEVHIGEIKSFSLVNGYGFIHCPELRKRFERDVFLHESQYEGLKVGDRVSFTLQVKRGQPQATSVAKHRSEEAGHRSEAAVNGQEEERNLQPLEDSAQLSRKLLRACASARAESVDSVSQALEAGAEAIARDVTGQTTIMVASLNVRHAERKCRLLIEHRADVHAFADAEQSLTILQWARQRINAKFANYLEAVSRGESCDLEVSQENPSDDL